MSQVLLLHFVYYRVDCVLKVDRHKTVKVGGLKLSKDVYLGGGDGKLTSVPPKYRAPEFTRGGKITEKVCCCSKILGGQ